MNKLVEGYTKYTGIDVKIKKHSGDLGTTLIKSDLEEHYNIDKFRSFLGKLMWYTTKVRPDMANAAREFSVHMSCPGTGHWKS